MAVLELTDSEIKRVKELLKVFSEIENIGTPEKPVYKVTCDKPVIITAKHEFGIFAVKQIMLDGRSTLINTMFNINADIRNKIANSGIHLKALLRINPNANEIRHGWLKKFRLNLMYILKKENDNNEH